jgi:hypothetical protein
MGVIPTSRSEIEKHANALVGAVAIWPISHRRLALLVHCISAEREMLITMIEKFK